MFVVERRGKYSSNLHTLYTIEEREIEYGNIILNSLISGCKQLRENNLFFSVKKNNNKNHRTKTLIFIYKQAKPSFSMLLIIMEKC